MSGAIDKTDWWLLERFWHRASGITSRAGRLCVLAHCNYKIPGALKVRTVADRANHYCTTRWLRNVVRRKPGAVTGFGGADRSIEGRLTARLDPLWAVAHELRKGGFANLKQNLRSRTESMRVDVDSRLTGTPLVEFDPRSRKVRERT
jgi:hypothetical protein